MFNVTLGVIEVLIYQRKTAKTEDKASFIVSKTKNGLDTWKNPLFLFLFEKLIKAIGKKRRANTMIISSC